MRRRRRRDVSTSAKDRKSTRLNSSHPSSSYAVFCLKKKTAQEGNFHRREIIFAHHLPHRLIFRGGFCRFARPQGHIRPIIVRDEFDARERGRAQLRQRVEPLKEMLVTLLQPFIVIP